MNPLRRFAPWVSDTWRQVLTTLVPRWRPRDWRTQCEEVPVETPVAPPVVDDVPVVAAPSNVVDFAPPVGNDIGHTEIVGVEEAGSARWNLRRDLLDRLDEYFVTIAQVRRYDPDAYALFSKVGWTIGADVYVNPDADDHRLFHWQRAAFGGCTFPVGTDGYDPEKVQLSFIYFQKLDHPTSVQRVSDATIYALTVFYDKRATKAGHWRSEVAVPARCHIAVLPDGQMHLLKEAFLTTREVRPGTKRGRRSHRPIQVKTVQWQIPSWLHDDEITRSDPNAWTTGILRLAVGTCASALDKINVRVKKDGCAAMFGIDITRAKTFFADRDVMVLAADGKKKRIFHYVKSHPRRLASGVIEVVAHYRGLQSFTWKSYDVHIVTPELSTTSLQVPMSYLEDIPVAIRDTYLDTAQVGQKIADHLDTPLHHPRQH